ncbi:hypothetical protein GCM10018793_60390 [Streptomyces sulfonofaciens]|uniref:Uncharacterized protein n=1 Tax=Streptomyces sulfonofaciens TaxID=68272 RepID=A0A919GML2_9ACTN|nr:hypothetical protein [Streptomyces sulfonofaciens]GHH86853.1 hypothetical protein GCM10018793_60390 [Streptomyces sulfonofaciens]
MAGTAYGPPAAFLHADTGLYGIAGEAWLRVPVYVSGLLRFPLKDNDFKEQYGDIGDAAEHKLLVSAVKEAQDFLTAYGDPVTLTKKIAHDGDYLKKTTPPPEFYAQAVWAAYRAQHAANQFASRARSLRATLEKSPHDFAKNAALVRGAFTGAGGLSSLSAEQKGCFAELLRTAKRTPSAFQGVQKALADRMGTKSKTCVSAREASKEYEGQALAFDGAADEAWAEWLEYRGAQPSQALDVCVVNVAVPVGTADLGGQAPKAKALAARSAYNVLLDALGKASDEVACKACLAADLGGFDRQSQALPDALSSLHQWAGAMAAGWDDVFAGLARACALSDDVLGDPAKLNGALAFDEGAKAWETLATATGRFTESALVGLVFEPWGLPLSAS